MTYVPLVVILGVISWVGVRVAGLPSRERNRLAAVIGIAFALRVLAMIVLHVSQAWWLDPIGAVNPDTVVVHEAVLAMLRDPSADLVLEAGSYHTFWPSVGLALYSIFWPSLTWLKVINVLLGTTLVPLVFLTGRELRLRGVWLATWVMALYPAAIAWSSFALRESLIAVMIMLTFLGGAKLILGEERRLSRRDVGWAAVVVTGVLALFYIRTYMTSVLVGLLAVVSVVRSWRERNTVPLVRTGAVVLTVAVAATVLPLGPRLARLNYELVFAPAAGQVLNPFSAGDIGRGDRSDIERERKREFESTVTSVRTAGLVEGAMVGILGGRPQWRPQEFYLLVQPSLFIWWLAVPFAAFASYRLARERRYSLVLLTAGFVVGMMAFQMLTGASVRHHFMMEPVGILLASHGWLVCRRVGRWERRALSWFVGIVAFIAAGSVVESVLASVL